MKQAAPIPSPPQTVVSQPGATPETTPAPAAKLPATTDSAIPELPSGPAAQLQAAEPSHESSDRPISPSPQHTATQTQTKSQPNPTLPAIERIHLDITRLYYLTNTVRLTPLCPNSEPPRNAKGNVLYCTPVRALTHDEQLYFDDWVEMLGWEAKAGLEALPELAVPDHPPKGYVEWSWFHGEGSVMPPVVGKWRKLRAEGVGKGGNVWKSVGWSGGVAGGSKEQTEKEKEEDEDEDGDAKTVRG